MRRRQCVAIVAEIDEHSRVDRRGAQAAVWEEPFYAIAPLCMLLLVMILVTLLLLLLLRDDVVIGGHGPYSIAPSPTLR